MGKSFFQRYFEDYTEEKIPGSDGKMHITRTYRGFWYAPQLTQGQRILRAVAYLLLYAGGLALFILGAMRPCACNVAWYVAIATGLSLFSVLIELIPLCGCALGKAEQTVYQYRSGHRTCVLWARITAGCMASTALLAILATLLAGETIGAAVLLFALGALCEAAVGEAESRVPYERRHNAKA
ncbi:MAG: hypothetical protein PUH70_03635 [Clostridiales bacterium]|nr:hypothetical protein [Clostridiales bacterium]MDY5514776.1 hypothetical protein [Candidatus Ventricola sp.]